LNKKIKNRTKLKQLLPLPHVMTVNRHVAR